MFSARHNIVGFFMCTQREIEKRGKRGRAIG